MLNSPVDIAIVFGIALLVFGPMAETQIATAVKNGITPGVVGPEELENAARVAKDRDVTIHLKIDSGMGRMGIVASLQGVEMRRR